MVSKLNARPIGVVEIPTLPPFVWMEKDRLISPLQLYEYDDVVFLLVEALPSIKARYSLFKSIVDWVAERFKEAVVIGGLDQRFKFGTDDLRCAATEAYIRNRGLTIPLIEKGLMITGPLALMLHRFEVIEFPAVALLPYANAFRPDPLAAAKSIAEFNRLYGLNIGYRELIEDAERIEHEVEEVLKRREESEKESWRQTYI